MPQIEGGPPGWLEEAAGRVPTLEAERDTARRERDQAVAEARGIRNAEAARAVIGEAVAASTTPVSFTALETRGLLSDLPVTAEGALDATAYRAAVETAVAEKAKAGGAGSVRGFGASEDAGGETKPGYTWGDIDKIMSKGPEPWRRTTSRTMTTRRRAAFRTGRNQVRRSGQVGGFVGVALTDRQAAAGPRASLTPATRSATPRSRSTAPGRSPAPTPSPPSAPRSTSPAPVPSR